MRISDWSSDVCSSDLAGRCRIVGYPKFELMGALSGARPSFAERRPTVLYNPHFERGLSSWRRMGRDVLEFFRASPDYNLIFAPHVVLYQRGLRHGRSEEHTSELQSLMRISYAVFC